MIFVSEWKRAVSHRMHFARRRTPACAVGVSTVVNAPASIHAGKVRS
jgi:hypothetical protein